MDNPHAAFLLLRSHMLFIDRYIVLPSHISWDSLLPAKIREMYPSIEALNDVVAPHLTALSSLAPGEATGPQLPDDSVEAWRSWQTLAASWPSAEMFSLLSAAERIGPATGGGASGSPMQGPYFSRVQFPLLHHLLHYISSPSLPPTTALALHCAVGEVLRYPGIVPVPCLPLWEWCDVFARHFAHSSPGRHITGVTVLRAVCFFFRCDKAEALTRYVQPLMQHRVLQVAVTAAKSGFSKEFSNLGNNNGGAVLLGDLLRLFEYTSFSVTPLPSRLYLFETRYPMSDILTGLVAVFSPESAVEGSIELMYLNRNHQLLLREDELLRGRDGRTPLPDQEDGAFSLRPLNFRRYVMSCWHTCKSVTPERDNRPLADEAMLVRTEMVVFAFLQISSGNNPKGPLPEPLPDRCEAPTVLMVGFPPHLRDDELVRGLKSVYDVLEMKFGSLEGLPYRANNDPVRFRLAVKEVGVVTEALIAAQFYMPCQSLSKIWIPRTALSTTFRNPLMTPNRSSNGFETWGFGHGGFGLRGVRGSPSANLSVLGCAAPQSGLTTGHPNTLTSASRLILLCQDYAEAAGVVCLGCAVYYQGDLITSDAHPYVARLLWLTAYAHQKSALNSSTLSASPADSPIDECRKASTHGSDRGRFSSGAANAPQPTAPIGLPSAYLVAGGAFEERHFRGLYEPTPTPDSSEGHDRDGRTPRQLPATAVPSTSSLAARLEGPNQRGGSQNTPALGGGQCESILINGRRSSTQSAGSHSTCHALAVFDFVVTLSPHLCSMLWASSRAASLPTGFLVTHDRDEREAWKAAAERRDEEREEDWKQRVLQLRKLFVHMSKQRKIEPGEYPCQHISHSGIEIVLLMHNIVAVATPQALSAVATFRKSLAATITVSTPYLGNSQSKASPLTPSSPEMARQALGTVHGRLGVIHSRFALSFEAEMTALRHCHLQHSVLKKPRAVSAGTGSSTNSGQGATKTSGAPRAMGLLHVKSSGGVCMLEASSDLRSVSQVGGAESCGSVVGIQRANDLIHEARHITRLLGSTMAAPRGASSSFFSQSFATQPVTRAILGRSAFSDAGRPLGRTAPSNGPPSTGMLGTYQVLYGRSAMERDVVLGTALPGATLRTSEDGYVEFTKAAASSNVFLI